MEYAKKYAGIEDEKAQKKAGSWLLPALVVGVKRRGLCGVKER